MNYRPRILEAKIKKLAKYFKIIFLVGARQVGKSSLFSHLFPDLQSFVFDPVQDIYGAKKDPDLFLENFKPPLILDEIQYASELLPALKRKVDQSDQKGQYYLTGSQQMSILKSVSESLAGRVTILEVRSMSVQEIYNQNLNNNWVSNYLSDNNNFKDYFKSIIKDIPTLYEILWRGGMPGSIDLPDDVLPTYFSSYVQTYIERDLRLLENIEDLSTFGRFFAVLSALTAQEINYNQLGREIGITNTDAKRWLKLLTYTYQWYEVPSYHGNLIKRVSNKPKGFFSDTGLACYLQRITSPLSLAASPLLGAIFETFCFNMIKVLTSVLPTQPNIYHWRDISGNEVDLILELDGKLYPIEIKCKTNLTNQDTLGIKEFNNAYPNSKIMNGLVIYAGQECYKLADNIIALPWNAIA